MGPRPTRPSWPMTALKSRRASRARSARTWLRARRARPTATRERPSTATRACVSGGHRHVLARVPTRVAAAASARPRDLVCPTTPATPWRLHRMVRPATPMAIPARPRRVSPVRASPAEGEPAKGRKTRYHAGGSVIRTSAPSPSVGSSTTLPPCACRTVFTMASPRPVPLRSASVVKKRSNTR